MRRFPLLITTLMLVLLVLSGCADEGDPASAIEDYLKAKVASDTEKLNEVMCNELEDQVEAEAASFASVKAELQDMSCQESDRSDNLAHVTCTGEIVVDYGGEQRSFSLSDTVYRALKEGDEWKMCGEGQ